jgi:outer membrane protein assembly factor BamA
MYLGLDSGMVWDSTIAALGKKSLMDTYLFSKVDVIKLSKQDGMHVFVVVTELFYWYPGGSIDLIQGKYGNNNTVWWRGRLGISIQNFRGLNETFSIGTTFWEDRSLSLSWSKPFLPSPYYFSIGGGASEYPDLGFPRRRLVANGRVSVGRKFLAHSRSYITVVPTYTKIDSLDDPANVRSYKEIIAAVGWSTDGKNRSYDPTSGWAIHTELNSNGLYSDRNNPYLQMYNDFRFYHRGIFPDNRLAYRIVTVLRTNDAGPYKGLYTGGEGSIRGWARDAFGRSSIMNDYVTFSTEYRFNIYPTPTFDFPILCDYIPSFKDFYLRADGAFFLDAGHIWRDLVHPLTVRENAAGAGFGLRILAPTFLRSGCIDIAWAIPGTSNPFGYKFNWIPGYHVYLDMYY